MSDIAIVDWLPGYGISRDGRVYSYKSFQWLKCSQLSTNGYPQTRLMVNGSAKTFLIHRLVAEAWCKKPASTNMVNHKNGVKTDNRAENLEWTTRTGNVKHAMENGLIPHGENHNRAKLIKGDIERIKDQFCCGEKQVDIAKRFGACQGRISDIIRGKSWKTA